MEELKDTYYRLEGRALSNICVLKGLHENKKIAILTNVQSSTDAAGKGWIKELMRQVCDDADRLGIHLLLSVDPSDEDPKENPMDVDRLMRFYGSFGFVAFDAGGDCPGMKRDPKVAAAI